MRAYMLEKLITAVSNARIIFNYLQPKRADTSIKRAAEAIALELTKPFLAQKKQAREDRKAGRKTSGPESKLSRVSSKTGQVAWQGDMVDILQHLPIKVTGDKRTCKQCSREKRKSNNKTIWYCKGCTEMDGQGLIYLCFNKPDGRTCFIDWHRSHSHATRRQ